MLGKRFRKGQQKIAAFVMALIMVITGLGVPIKAEAAGRKIVKKLTVTQTSLELEEGEREDIKYKVTATKGTNKKIVVKVSNKKVVSAKVSGKKIVVRAKKEGKSIITVMTKAKNKNGKKIAKKIRVVVENQDYDDDEAEYVFEDDEAYEKDETEEDTDVSIDKNHTTEVSATTEKAEEKPAVTEAPATTEKEEEKPVVTEASATTERVTDKPVITEAPAVTEKVATTETPATIKKEETIPSISYQAHVQYNGWMPNVKDGATAGTTDQAKRLEGLKIILQDDKGNSMIKYRAHVEDTGWQGWKISGQAAGTEQQSKRMEGIQIQLTGTYAEKYDIYYCVHVANFGWLGWAKNGETAGSEGLSLQMEAIKIKLVKKNAPFSVGGRHVIVRPNLTYQAHCAYCGWQNAVGNGNTSGTIGEKRQLEGLKINLLDTDGKSGIEYRAHVSDVGWQGWKDSGVLAGTTGESRKMEAIEIKLKGNLAKDFDIYYRMHVSDIGWMGWAKNGETAGTTGGARQAEAIEIRLVGKGASIDRGGAAYQKLTAQPTSGTASAVVSVAASQVGYHEKASNYNLDGFTANSGSANYNKYARDLGVANGQAWCATFVWWCMKSAGVPYANYPSRTTVTRDWFIQRGQYHVRGSYVPKPGDYVVFGNASHCGIVESVSGYSISVIEGNCSDQVKRNTYNCMTSTWIAGFGTINYN